MKYLLQVVFVLFAIASRLAAAPLSESLRTLAADTGYVTDIVAMSEDELECFTRYWVSREVFKAIAGESSHQSAEVRTRWYDAEKERIGYELKYGRDRTLDRISKLLRAVDWQFYRDIRTGDIPELIKQSVAADSKITEAISRRWNELKRQTSR